VEGRISQWIVSPFNFNIGHSFSLVTQDILISLDWGLHFFQQMLSQKFCKDKSDSQILMVKAKVLLATLVWSTLMR